MSPPNIRLDEDILKTSFVFVFRTCLQDVLIKANIFALVIRLQKTFSRRLQDVLVKTNIFVLAIRLQDVFKTFSRRLQDVFKTSCQDVFKTFSRRLQDVLQERLQDIFKTYHQVKLFLLTSLREVLQRRLSTEGFAQVTLLRNLWSVYKICKRDKNFSSFSFSLYYIFQWLLIEAYLEPGRTSTMELFLRKYFTALSCYFRKKAPSQMLDWVENNLLAKDLKY